MDIYLEIAKAKEQRKMVALVIVTKTVGSTPRNSGAKMLVYPDRTILGTIGGGAVEEKVIATAVRCLKTKQTQRLQFELKSRNKRKRYNNHGMICGGNMEVYIEPIFPDPVLYLIGAGHISYALARIMKLVGFKVVVIDSEKKYANRTRFPESVADEVKITTFNKAVEFIEFDTSAYIVILTRSHVSDKEVLTACLKKNLSVAYLGMIGSKQKIATIFADLIRTGISKQKLDSVYAPIGLDIAAETPEEIAVSIAAELIAVSHGAKITRRNVSSPIRT